MNRLQSFIEGARQEFKRINWPSTQETIRMTGIVIAMSICVAVFLGAIDFGLLYTLNNYLLQ